MENVKTGIDYMRETRIIKAYRAADEDARRVVRITLGIDHTAENGKRGQLIQFPLPSATSRAGGSEALPDLDPRSASSGPLICQGERES